MQKIFTKTPLGTSALEAIVPPMNIGNLRQKTLVFVNAADGAALADVNVEVGPTATGPWEEISLGSTGIATLAAGASATLRFTQLDEYMQVRAQAAVVPDHHCDLTLYVNLDE